MASQSLLICYLFNPLTEESGHYYLHLIDVKNEAQSVLHTSLSSKEVAKTGLKLKALDFDIFVP